MIGAAGEIEIADRVEHFVAHELVLVAQAAVGSARWSPLITTALSSEPPRARPAARRCATSSRKPKVRARLISALNASASSVMLMPCRRIARAFEIDREAHREAEVGRKRHRSALGDDADRLQHLDRAARRALLGDAGAFDQKDEGRGAAVHRSALRARRARRSHCRFQHRRTRPSDARRSRRDARTIGQHRATRRFDGVFPLRTDLAANVGPPEYNPGPRQGRHQLHRHPSARM